MKLVANLLYCLVTANKFIGKCFAPLALFMAIGTVIIVLLRYGWGIGAIDLQEAVLYAFATLWWLCAPLTLSDDGHVRVDIFYRKSNIRMKRSINFFGHCCLLIPTCVLLIGLSWRYVLTSWALQETSTEPGGLPFLYILKSLLLVGPAFMCLHAVLLSLLLIHEEIFQRYNKRAP